MSFWTWLHEKDDKISPDVRAVMRKLRVPKHAQNKLSQRCHWRIAPIWLIPIMVVAMLLPGAWSQFCARTGWGSPSITRAVRLGSVLAYCGLVVMMCAMFFVRRRRVLREELARRPCWECGYSLLHLPEPRCPECGTPFDPAEYERIEAAINGDDADKSDDMEAR